MRTADEKFMQLAVDKAWKYQFLTYPNPAVGAAVVKNGGLLSVEAHKKAGFPHAEVLALKEAYLTNYSDPILKDLENSHDIHNYLYENNKGFFKECEIYVTLEPCNHTGKTPACALLLENIQIKKVFIGTLDPNPKASGGMQRLQKAAIQVQSGICQKSTDDLLLPFTKWQSGNFTFFKLAMREDGSVDGGYITTKDSLSLVHEIRTKLDLMVIGGETVRVDRPMLDARFAKENRSPDILIYSKSKKDQFDDTIPLFGVNNREVKISGDLDHLFEKKLVMIEGGKNLLNILKNKVDMLMLFISHAKKAQNPFNVSDLGFEKVYSYFINDTDEVVFLKRK